MAEKLRERQLEECKVDLSRGRGSRGESKVNRQRNLLRAAVTPAHVGNAIVFFASNLTPTTGATLPVDGGIAEAFPR
jgi:hypothetical protein